MASDATKLLEHALRLSPMERAALADSLVDSLDGEADQDAESAWTTELSRRLEEITSGEVQLVSWDAARRDIRSRFQG